MSTIRISRVVALAALLLMTVIALGAAPTQQKKAPVPTASIEGKVMNAKGAGIQGVKIAIADVDAPGQALAEVVTNFQGRYTKSVPLTKNGYLVTPSKGKSTFTPANKKLSALGGLAEFTIK